MLASIHWCRFWCNVFSQAANSPRFAQRNSLVLALWGACLVVASRSPASLRAAPLCPAAASLAAALAVRPPCPSLPAVRPRLPPRPRPCLSSDPSHRACTRLWSLDFQGGEGRCPSILEFPSSLGTYSMPPWLRTYSMHPWLMLGCGGYAGTSQHGLALTKVGAQAAVTRRVRPTRRAHLRRVTSAMRCYLRRRLKQQSSGRAMQ